MSKGKWLKVGQILTKKDGNGYNVKIDADVTLKKGTYLQVTKPQDEIQRLVANGIITEEQGEERLAKIPDFVKFNLILPPAKDE